MAEPDLKGLAGAGVYILRRLDEDAWHPVMQVGDRGAMLVYSTAARAQQAADELGGAEVVHEPLPAALFLGLPEGATHLLLDYDPATGESWLLGAGDFAFA
ncbi:hypothetical protein BH24DEI1_BH24DEI1_11490 [soil metagenome]|jgi:hypothetical protein|nr:hypothetical protein [Deinococcota bacterium]